jgi:hypothetical protein
MAGIEDLDPVQRRRHNIGEMVENASPELFSEFQKLAKKMNKNLRIPEVDLTEKIEAERAEREKLAEQLEAQKIENKVYRLRAEQDARWKEQGFTRGELEKIAKEQGVEDLDVAFKFGLLQRETAVPTAAEAYAGRRPSNSTQVLNEELRKMSSSQRKQWSLNEGHKMLDDFFRTGKVHQ